MTRHVLIVALGPVQDFIAQARRTRDLWFGSHLLSELSRAAARHLAEQQGADLVFPALAKGDPELQPCWRPTRAGPTPQDDPPGMMRWRDTAQKTPPLGIANKIVAVVPSGIDPAQAARGTRQAVWAFWRKHGDVVKARCAAILAPGVDAAWNEQVDTTLEFVAAWQPVGEGGYRQARAKAEAAVAGRKRLREFSAWQHLRGAVYRSSLDGGRETVLAPPTPGSAQARTRRRYGIREGEQLDAVSLCKRAGGNPEQFVPTPNIALARWIERAAEVAPKALANLRRACDDIGIRRVHADDAAWRQALPFYADVLLDSQIHQVLAEAGHDLGPEQASRWFADHVCPLFKCMPEPYGYLAALVADGDHMGQAIDTLTSAADHRALSLALAGFSADARRIVEHDHRGALVYAGGDDVLALVCLTDALACARALRDAFSVRMEAFTRAHALPMAPTLSVGLGVAHRTEGLGDLVELGHQAERLAKQRPPGHPGTDRNALAILVTPRSGQRRSWRANWAGPADPAGCPVAQLGQDIARAPLAMRKIHAIDTAVRRLDGADDEVLRGEVRRILSHVGDGAEALRPCDVGLDLDRSSEPPAVVVRRFVDRQLVARVFVRAEYSSTPRAQAEVTR